VSVSATTQGEISVSKIRQNPLQLINRVNGGERLVITHNGQRQVAVISFGDFELLLLAKIVQAEKDGDDNAAYEVKKQLEEVREIIRRQSLIGQRHQT